MTPAPSHRYLAQWEQIFQQLTLSIWSFSPHAKSQFRKEKILNHILAWPFYIRFAWVTGRKTGKEMPGMFSDCAHPCLIWLHLSWGKYNVPLYLHVSLLPQREGWKSWRRSPGDPGAGQGLSWDLEQLCWVLGDWCVVSRCCWGDKVTGKSQRSAAWERLQLCFAETTGTVLEKAVEWGEHWTWSRITPFKLQTHNLTWVNFLAPWSLSFPLGISELKNPCSANPSHGIVVMDPGGKAYASYGPLL